MSRELARVEALQRAFLDIFLLVGELQTSRPGSRGGPGERQDEKEAPKAGSTADFRTWLTRRLESATQQLYEAKVPKNELESARLAVVGLVDEAARRANGPGLGENWTSLEGELYDEEIVGDRFFEQLEALRNDPNSSFALLEFYAQCLALGFMGRYAPDRLDELKRLREQLGYELRKRRSDVLPLAPDLILERYLDEPMPVLKPLWLFGVALSLLLIVSLSLALILLVRGHSVATVLEELRIAPSAGGAP